MVQQSRAHVKISGRVQGVNFRAHTREQARKAGVHGWVRNLDDGGVEAVFEGPRSSVQRLVSWCYGGPTYAEVDRVEVNWEQPVGQEPGFTIRW